MGEPLPAAWVSPGLQPNTDLARERAACSFDVSALTHLLDGGAEVTATRHKLQRLVEQDPVFTNEGNHQMDRAQRYARGLEKSKRMVALAAQTGLSPQEQKLMVDAIADDMPTLLHQLMFIPNIEQLCDEEQKARWLPDAMAWRMIGCYAQTELGHGSNIRALQTTATYIPATDEFEVDTPTLTAAKWWPGTLGAAGAAGATGAGATGAGATGAGAGAGAGAAADSVALPGRTANAAMVIAQLIVGGKKLGIHNFLVPIRDRATHMPLKGIRAGDIGPKVGYNNMDNGYLVMNKVRIPRINMAARYARVERDGTYVKVTQVAGADKVRALIIQSAGKKLAHACTIGVRYSVVRRQGFGANGAGENQILDYVTQAHRLLPMVATSFCWHFTGVAMVQVLNDLEARLHASDPTAGARMRAAHASFSGLKALTSGITADAIEDIRRACGGHGHLMASGIPELLQSYLQNCTVEGDNYMLPQQVTRILLGELKKSAEGVESSGQCAYFNQAAELLDPGCVCGAGSAEELRDAPTLLRAYAHRAIRLLQAQIAAGTDATAAWNSSLVEIGRASRAHSMHTALQAFADAVVKEQDSGNKAVLSRLLYLFGMFWIEKDMGDFVEDGYLNQAQAADVRAEVVALINELRPDAVSLVDSWDFSDFVLKSALGRFDGDVYPALMNDAQESALNQQDPVVGWREHGSVLESGEATAAAGDDLTSWFGAQELKVDKARL